MDHLEQPAIRVRDTSLDKTLRKLRAAEYPQYAVYLFACVIFVSALLNAIHKLHTYFYLHTYREIPVRDTEVGPRPIRRYGGVSLRRLPSAIVNSARVVACRVSVRLSPGVRFTLIEVLVCICHLMALLVFEFINTRNVTGLIDAQYWANRAAVLAISQLALIVALSGKNNVISVITGISYGKLNVFHRAASRTVLILIWVHMWGRWKLGFTGNDSLEVGWVRSGIVSNICLTLMVILGARPVRFLAYEFFLTVHNILSVILLVTACIHVTNARQFLPYVWSACIFLALDRALRLARTLRIRYLSGRVGANSRAAVVALSTDTVVICLRVSTSFASVRFGWNAGQNAYLSIPAVAKWGFGLSTEAHPFSIASINAPAFELDRPRTAIEHERGQEPRGETTEAELKFIVRVRNGFTRRLHEYTMRAGGSCTVSAYVDGPYGSPPSVSGYHNVVLIAGGSGVSFTLPLLLDLLRRARTGLPQTGCRKVKFFWYIRKRIHLEAISKELNSVQDNVPGKILAELSVFVTGESESHEELADSSLEPRVEKQVEDKDGADATGSKDDSSMGTPGSECEKAVAATVGTANQTLSMVYGKPVIAEILKNEIGESENSVAVCVSGPQSLIDDVRDTLKNPDVAGPMAILRGGPSVFLHVENFGM